MKASTRYRAAFLLTCVAVGLAGSARPAAAVPTAADSAASPAYADGWQTGDNGGFGFGPWELNASGAPIQHPAAHFIDAPPPLPANRIGSPAFVMTSANNSFTNGDFTGARRAFLVPPVPGDIISFEIDGPSFNTGTPFPKHAEFLLLGPDNSTRFRLVAAPELGTTTWRVGAPGFDPFQPGTDTGIPVDSAFRVELRLKPTPRSYDLVLSPLGGGQPLFTHSNFLPGADIAAFRFSLDSGSSAEGTNELFFNNLTVDVPEPSAPTALLTVALLPVLRRRRHGAAPGVS